MLMATAVQNLALKTPGKEAAAMEVIKLFHLCISWY